MLHVKTPSCISEEGRCDQNVTLLLDSYQITVRERELCLLNLFLFHFISFILHKEQIYSFTTVTEK